MRLRNVLSLVVALAICSPSYAQQAAPSGWQTWTWEGSCYAVLFPEDPGVEQLKSKKAYAAVRHIPAEQTINSVSFVSGLEDDTGLKGTVDIDGKPFNLLVYQGAGFVSSGDRENALLAAMEAGTQLKVRWTTPDSMVEQVYKLAGLPQAKRTIDTACLGEATPSPAN